MTIGKALIAAAVLALAAPTTAAFAHDDDYDQHARDHAAHWSFHREVNEAHGRAHEEGFYSGAEHRAYHRALRDLHNDFHEDHPGTRHDHYTWGSYSNGSPSWYRSLYSYGSRYWYGN